MTVTFSKLGSYGRLGNQIFELASAIALALDNNDTYIFPPWKYEPYFNLHNCFSNIINPTKTYTEPFFHYGKIPYSNTKNEVLDIVGYFQSYKYFESHSDFIKQVFTTTHNIPPQLNATSIHVRRTDYLKVPDCHTNLDMNYYRQAMSLCPSEKYYIFSDDIAWCKGQFIGSQFQFIENNHETFDLDLMSKCANNIICNSSFSWWSAWLNNNPNKKIIYPKNWFGPALQHDTKDLMPQRKNWIGV
jgi:hypothetical protein